LAAGSCGSAPPKKPTQPTEIPARFLPNLVRFGACRFPPVSSSRMTLSVNLCRVLIISKAIAASSHKSLGKGSNTSL